MNVIHNIIDTIEEDLDLLEVDQTEEDKQNIINCVRSHLAGIKEVT